MNKGIEKILETKGIFIAQKNISGKCVFLFPGHGAQYVGMCKELYQTYPVIKEIFDRVEKKYFQLTRESLIEKIFSTSSGAEDTLLKPTIMQPAIFLADVAMYELLKSWNIHPDYLLGHSLGELAALYAAGCFGLEEGVEIVYNRAVAVESIPKEEAGGMISISSEYSDALKDKLLSIPKGKCQVSIINSIHQFNISGTEKAIQAIKRYCDTKKIKSTILKVSHAFHSEMLKDAVPVYKNALKKMEYHEINIPVYSTILQKFYDSENCDPQFFSEILSSQLVTPFDFRKIILDLITNLDVKYFIEVGPKNILSRMVEDIDSENNCSVMSTNKKGQDEILAINNFRAQYECFCSEAERKKEVMTPNSKRLNMIDELAHLISLQTMYPEDVIKKSNLDIPFMRELAITESIGKHILDKIVKLYDIHIEEEKLFVLSINEIINLIIKNNTEGNVEESGTIKTSDNIMEFVLKSIEDITGYEKSMLEENLDLEADLGIDSVKQGELWNKVSENFSFDIENIKNIKDICTIKQMVDYVANQNNTSSEKNVKESEINIRNTILALIEEKTGYPSDMLEDDLDLEADLGIDSVKQGEIFSCLRTKFGIVDIDYNIKEYNTIGSIIDLFYKQRFRETILEEVSDANIKKDEGRAVEEKVLRIIEEKTGYPIEMLSNNLDLEADLGIDSVKRTEILNILQEIYEFQIQEQADLKELNTIEDIIRYIQTNINCANSVDKEKNFFSSEYSTTRYVAVPVEQNIMKDNIQEIDNKNVLIVADNFNGEITSLLYEKIKKKANNVIVVGQKLLGGIGNMDIVDFSNITDIKNKISEINQKNTIDIVINLMAISEMIDLDTVSKEEWTKICSEIYNSHFYVTKVLYNNFFERKEECGYYSVTSIGGVYGLESGYPGNPIGAIGSGFTKALEKELRPFCCKVIDFSDLKNADEISEFILSEIECREKLVEVAYINGIRKVIYVLPKEIKKDRSDSYEISNQDVILVTGGGRGIIYKCIERLLDYCNPKIIVTGRTELDSIDEKIVEMTDDEFKAYKTTYLSECRNTNPGFSLLQLQHSYEKLRNARLLMKNMKILYDKGYNIEYRKCDVASIDEVEKLVEYTVNKYGRITGIINGAGLPSFGKVPKKEEEFAEQVVKVKANSFYALYQVCREQPLKFFVSMGSISGRFGMDGQVDYSAAADLIVRLSYLAAQKRKNTRFFVLGWSAWDEVGMAANEEVKKVQQETRGLEYISVEEGTNRFLNELLYGGEYQEILFFGKLGKENLPLGQLDALDENLKDMREACNREGYIIDKIKFPLLDRIILLEKNRIAVTKKLMLNTDLHLKDHLVEGKHVFAGVMHVESACELFKLYLEQKGLYDYHITGVEGFKFEKFIKVFNQNELELKIEGSLVEDNMDCLKMYVAIKSDFTNKNGITIEKDRLHSEGYIVASKNRPLGEKEEYITVDQEEKLDIDKYYRNSDKMITFGDSFRCISDIQKVNNNTLIGILQVPEDGNYFSFVSHADTCISPVSIDNMGRLMLFHDFDKNGYSIVPIFIGEAKKYRDFWRGEKIKIVCTFEKESGTSVFYSAYAIDNQEEVIFEIKHMELQRINRYDGDHSLINKK